MKENKTNSTLKIIEWKCNQRLGDNMDDNIILNENINERRKNNNI